MRTEESIPPFDVVSTSLNVTELTVLPITTAFVCIAIASRDGTVIVNVPVDDTVYLATAVSYLMCKINKRSTYATLLHTPEVTEPWIISQ